MLLGCADAPPPPRTPTTLKTHPHAMDRLARLERAEVTDLHPQPIEQAMACERYRAEMAIGASDFALRHQLLIDSVQHEFGPAAIHRMERRMNGAVIESGDGPTCDPIHLEAGKEVPLTYPSGRGAIDSKFPRRRPHPEVRIRRLAIEGRPS
jgi:hypothetical protein